MAMQKRSGVAAVVAASALAPTVALATPFDEATVGDFGDVFEECYALPPGTDVVSGTSPFEAMDADVFCFTDLVPYSAFSVDFTAVSTDESIGFGLRTGTGNPLAFVDVEFGTWSVAGVVPYNGKLMVTAGATQDFGTYAVAIDAERVPEPGPASLTAVALAALGMRRFVRRR